MAIIGDIEVIFGAKVADLLAGVTEAKEAIEGLAAPITALNEWASGLAEAFAAGFAVERIAEFAEKFADLGEKALNTAFILGSTVEESDRIVTAMRILGVDTDSAARTLQFLGRSVQQAMIDPASRAATGFRNIGISMTEVHENAKNLTGMLSLVVEKVGELEHSGLQASGALRDVLGRGMQTLAPLLRAGAEEFHNAQIAAADHTKAMVENAAGMDNTAVKMHSLGVSVETFGIKMFGLFKQDIDGVIHSLNNLLDVGSSVISWLKYLGDQFNQVNKDVTDAGRAVNNFIREMAGLGPAAYADIPAKLEPAAGTHQIGTEKAGKGKSGKDTDDRMSVWRDELRTQLEDEKKFFSDSKSEELAFWQAKLAMAQGGSDKDIKLRRELHSQIFTLEKELAKQNEQNAIEEQTYQGKVYDVIMERKKAQIQADLNLGKINEQQAIAGEKALLDAKMQADTEYYHKKEAAAEGDLATITKLEQQEYLDHEKLVSEKIALDNKMAEANHKSWTQIGDSITRAFDTAVMGVIQGTQTIGQAFAKLGQSILASLGNLVIDSMTKSIWKSLEGLLGGGIGLAGGGGIGSLLGGLPLIGGLFGGAGLQSAGFSSILNALPFFEKGGIVSAAGGWQVPSGGSMAVLHAQEMVLPKHIADHVDATAGGQGVGGDMHMHFHGPADGASIHRWVGDTLRQNPNFVRDLYRKNAITPRNS